MTSCIEKKLEISIDVRSTIFPITELPDDLRTDNPEIKETHTRLICKEDKCEITENRKKVMEKKVNNRERKKISDLIDKINKKKNKNYIRNVYTVSTTVVVSKERMPFFYIPYEVEEIFNLLSYKNSVLVNDETEEAISTKKYSFEYAEEFKGKPVIWKLYYDNGKMKILHYKENQLLKSWEISLDNKKEENIKKRLFEILSDTPLPDRTMVKSNHMIIMDNGKSYRKTDYANTEFKEMLKGILGKDYEDYIEKSEK